MEIKKIFYVLLLGVVLCLAFAGVLKCTESTGEEERLLNQQTASPYAEESTVLVEKPMNEQAKQEAEQATKEPIEEKMVSTEELKEEAEEVKEEQITSLPVTTVTPTTVPTSEPIQEKEVPPVQNTTLPVATTMAPQEPQVPLSQSMNTPMPTKEPAIGEVVHVHEFEKAVWELPTCQKGGYYNNICKICGFEESVTQEPLPHQVEDVIIQEGNCMEDRVIRHICTECEVQVGSDTRYPLYDVHQWAIEEVDGVLMEYCERCGVVK